MGEGRVLFVEFFYILNMSWSRDLDSKELYEKPIIPGQIRGRERCCKTKLKIERPKTKTQETQEDLEMQVRPSFSPKRILNRGQSLYIFSHFRFFVFNVLLNDFSLINFSLNKEAD